jgi:hypothetical protein
MKRFYIVDDYTSNPIWDEFLCEQARTLPSKPQGKGWERWCGSVPQGSYTIANGMAPLASGEAYAEAGITEPTYDQLPVVFCVTENGVEQQRNVTAAQAAAFIRSRIA